MQAAPGVVHGFGPAMFRGGPGYLHGLYTDERFGPRWNGATLRWLEDFGSANPDVAADNLARRLAGWSTRWGAPSHTWSLADGQSASLRLVTRTLIQGLLPLGRGDVLSVQLHVVEIATTPRPPRNTKCRRRWPSPSRHADVAAQWR
jgi:hypothetical protein